MLITIEDFKYIQTWAEFGLTCEKTTVKLSEQIERDRIIIETLDNELIEKQRRNNRLKAVCGVLGSSLSICVVYIWMTH